jgi:hypothetical protein
MRTARIVIYKVKVRTTRCDSLEGGFLSKLIAIQPLAGTERIFACGSNPAFGNSRLRCWNSVAIQSQSEELILRPAILGENHVSSRLVAGAGAPS